MAKKKKNMPFSAVEQGKKVKKEQDRKQKILDRVTNKNTKNTKKKKSK